MFIKDVAQVESPHCSAGSVKFFELVRIPFLSNLMSTLVSYCTLLMIYKLYLVFFKITGMGLANFNR